MAGRGCRPSSPARQTCSWSRCWLANPATPRALVGTDLRPTSCPPSTSASRGLASRRATRMADVLGPARRRHDDPADQARPGLGPRQRLRRHPDRGRRHPLPRPQVRRHGARLGPERQRPARRRHDDPLDRARPGLGPRQRLRRHPRHGRQHLLPRPQVRRHGARLGRERRRLARRRRDDPAERARPGLGPRQRLWRHPDRGRLQTLPRPQVRRHGARLGLELRPRAPGRRRSRCRGLERRWPGTA
jgi:hypothetical protein